MPSACHKLAGQRGNRAIGTMVQTRAAAKKSACEQGCSSKARVWSATPSARSNGFDNVDSGLDCGVYIQMCGIEQVRVRGHLQG